MGIFFGRGCDLSAKTESDVHETSDVAMTLLLYMNGMQPMWCVAWAIGHIKCLFGSTMSHCSGEGEAASTLCTIAARAMVA